MKDGDTWAQAKKPPEARGGLEEIFLECLHSKHGPAHTLISDFWPLELYEKYIPVVLSQEACGT